MSIKRFIGSLSSATKDPSPNILAGQKWLLNGECEDPFPKKIFPSVLVVEVLNGVGEIPYGRVDIL